MIKHIIFLCLLLFCSFSTRAAIETRWEHPDYKQRMDKREILSFVEISKTPQGQHFQIEAEGKTNVSAERAMRALWSEKCWEKYIPTIHKLRALRSSPDKKIIFIEASILRLY